MREKFYFCFSALHGGHSTNTVVVAPSSVPGLNLLPAHGAQVIAPTSVPGLGPVIAPTSVPGLGQIVAPTSVPGLGQIVAPTSVPGLDLSPRPVQQAIPQHVVHEPYIENRVLTPTVYRQQQKSPRREFATQTGETHLKVYVYVTK